MGRIRVAVAVQHVITRDQDSVYLTLKQRLKRERVHPIVITDHLEHGHHGDTWKTYARCLEAIPRAASHLLVLQDDVELCPGFMPAVRQAVAARPTRLLSFFLSHLPQSSHRRQQLAHEAGHAWSTLDREEWTPAQALSWPRRMIPDVLAYHAERPPRGPWRGDDEAIGRFLRDTRQDALQSCPSLVEHAHHSTTSLVMINTNTGIQRSAWQWIGDTGDATTINWTKGPE